ncbi:MAG: PD40 domain-containing protein [Spirochaetes bacterium]|nr:PD40 domain-containing protein [Spirochaetota bacterium]
MIESDKYLRLLYIVLLLFIFSPLLSAQVVHVDKVINIGPPINTADDDFAPSFTADGKTMVFNSKRGSRYQDIYISYFEGDAWTDPVPLTELNSPYTDESPYITSDGAFIFFSSDRDGSFETRDPSTGRIKISFDIYVSENVEGKWRNPIKVPGKINTAAHERSPSFSYKTMCLYYTRLPFGDWNKARIMKADYVDGDFINPVELPAPVNIGAMDAGLIPSPDGKGFFFSSGRPGGYGGWDIYYADYYDGIFGEPVNLGDKINSPQNEINISVIEDYVYFCSNREGGQGRYDVYTSKIVVVNDKLRISVLDKKTGKPMQVEVDISTRIKEGEKQNTYSVKKRTDENGKAVLKYQPEVKDLDIAVNEEGYLPFFEKINILSLKNDALILELVPIEKEASFDIHSIYFDFESAKIKPESYLYLNAFVGYMKKHKTMKFEIIGHTDLHGSDAFNDKLSLDRAVSVKNYLAGKGIDGTRLSVRGAGKRKPIIPQIGSEFDEKNRRTEFKLLEK